MQSHIWSLHKSITQCKMQCRPNLIPYCSLINYLYLRDHHLMSIPDIRGQHFRLWKESTVPYNTNYAKYINPNINFHMATVMITLKYAHCCNILKISHFLFHNWYESLMTYLHVNTAPKPRTTRSRERFLVVNGFILQQSHI